MKAKPKPRTVTIKLDSIDPELKAFKREIRSLKKKLRESEYSESSAKFAEKHARNLLEQSKAETRDARDALEVLRAKSLVMDNAILMAMDRVSGFVGAIEPSIELAKQHLEQVNAPGMCRKDELAIACANILLVLSKEQGKGQF